jgi:hypothetical protein
MEWYLLDYERLPNLIYFITPHFMIDFTMDDLIDFFFIPERDRYGIIEDKMWKAYTREQMKYN